MDFDRIYDRVTKPDDSGFDAVYDRVMTSGFGGIYDKVMPVQTTKRIHGGASGKFTGGGEFDGAGASVKLGDSASEAEAKEIAAKIKLSPVDKWFDRTLRNKEPEKTKELYAKAGDFLTGSAADFSRGFYSTLDFILPDEIINQGDNWFSKFLDDAQRVTREKADKKDEIIADQGKAGQTGLKILDGSLQALPQAIIALMSGGTSAGAQLGAQGAGLAQTAGAYMRQLAKNPSFYLSLTQTLGKSYEDAVADGATEQEAVSTAIISSLLNSAVEVSGGIEKIPGSKRSLRNWVKGMAEEGGEEVVQGVIDQLTRKAVYDPDRPLAGVDAKQVNRLLGTDIPEDVRNALLSTTGEDAVFDPVRAAQEFGLGAAVGGILGGGEMVVGKAVDTVRGRRANAVHGEPVDFQIKRKGTPQKAAYPQSEAGGRAAVLSGTIVSQDTEPAGSGIPGNGAGDASGGDILIDTIVRDVVLGKVNRRSALKMDAGLMETAALLAKRTGRNIRIVETLGNGIDGKYDAATNTLYVAADSAAPLYTVLKHELTHSLEGTQAYDELSSYILRTMGAHAEERIAAKTEQYARAGETLSREQAIQELVADYAGEELFTSDDAIRRLTADRPDLARRILEWIRSMRTKLFGTPQEKLLARAEQLYLTALAQPAVQRDGVQYSIRYTDDNRPVVVVEEDILEGVPKNAWVRKVKQTISERFSGGIPVSGRLVKVNAITRDETTHSKNSQWYEKHATNVYEDKFRSLSNLDEIVLASTNYVNEDLKHKRKDTFKEFARGDVLIRVGDRDYAAKVIIGFTTGNQMVLYDVIDFTPSSFQMKSGSAFASQAQTKSVKTSSNTSTDTTVPQSTDTVNSSISKSEANDALNGDIFIDAIVRDVVLGKASGRSVSNADAGLMETAERIAANTGRNIRIVETLGNGIDGKYDAATNTLYVAADSAAPLYTVLKHELTHSLEGTQAYDELSSYILRTMGVQAEERIAAKTAQYARSGVALDREQAIRELVADYAGEELFTSDDAIRRLTADRPDLARRILEWIRSMRTKLFGTPQEKLMVRAEELYLAALAQPAVQKGSVQYKLEGYSERQKANWADSKSIVVYENQDQLEAFINDALERKANGKKMYFGRIPDALAQRVYKDTGIDISNYNCSVTAYEIQKILKDHGSEQTEAPRGQRPITRKDIANIPLIIQDPDVIRLSPNLYNGRPVIHFVKTIDGKTTVVAYTSQKHMDLTVQTMYASNKNGNLAKPTDEQASVNTPEANIGTVPIHILSQNTDNVKSNQSKSMPDNAQNMDSFLDEIMRDVMNKTGARMGNAVPTFGQEGEQHGRRTETRESFLDRIGKVSVQAEAAGCPAVRTRQVNGTLYAFLPAEEALQSQQAREIRRILAEYGIPADIVYETQANADGVTRTVRSEASALRDGSVLIKNTAGIGSDGEVQCSPQEIAAHEMTHEARRIAPEEYWAYYNLVVDEAIVTNQAYINFTDAIIRTYFTSRGRSFDITTDYPALYNEATAFIGGNLFDNEAMARERYASMFQDFDAVVDAWRRMEAAVRAKAGAREAAHLPEDAAAPQDYIELLLRSVLG